MEQTRTALAVPYLAFLRTGLKFGTKHCLLRVHLLIATTSNGRTDFSCCGVGSEVHTWSAVNDVQQDGLRSRLVACQKCARHDPNLFANLPRTL